MKKYARKRIRTRKTKRYRKTKGKISRTFRKKVVKVMRRLGPQNFFDVAFASSTMSAWGPAIVQTGQAQAVDVMQEFFGSVVNGVGPQNTIGNRVYLQGCHISGQIDVNALGAAPGTDFGDLTFRESILTPKDSYAFLSLTEQNAANSCPGFNQMWQPNSCKAKDIYFSMGTPLTTIAGIGTAVNLTKPCIRHFRRYLRINKELSDLQAYNAVGSSSTGVVVSNGQMQKGNKIWVIAPQTAGTLAVVKMQYTLRFYFKNYV
ncbi:capsid protein [Miresoil virus 445]|uniref:Capsid protein n=1 Tax=Miresoil virus 445 TaxID=2911464 RepID=A0A9E8Z0L2_9VIRU|nr:capsid protein [Miresoil virus 445]